MTVYVKKIKSSKRLGRKRRLENETILLLEGDTNDSGLIEIPGAACVSFRI